MSLELQEVNAKLKAAIQSHQLLVTQLQGQENNETLQQRLLAIRGEIMHWSREQKNICQAINNNYGVSGPPKTQVSPPVSTSSGGAATTPLTPPQQPPSGSPLLPPSPALAVVSVPVAHVQSVHQVTLAAPASSTQPTDLSVKTEAAAAPHPPAAPSKPPTPQVSPTLRASPPIRVPQYPVNSTKAPTLLGGKSAVLNTRSHMPPPDSMRKSRALSDSDVRDYRDSSIRAIVERKQLSPKVKRKMIYMAHLDLVTPETLKEMQNKRSERKRRSTANPQFSYSFEPDKKRFKGYLVSSGVHGIKRPRGRPPKQSPNNSHPSSPESPGGFAYKNGYVRNGSAEMDGQEEICSTCGQETPSLQCHTCHQFYHDQCLSLPPSAATNGSWTCPKCSASNHRNLMSNPATLAKVNTYIANRAAKEDERKKVQKKNADLQNEKSQLENKSKELTDTYNQQLERKQHLQESNQQMQQSVESLQGFVKHFKT